MRNTFLKDVRKAWDDSRVIFGRTKIMAKALGTTQEDEYMENMHKLSQVDDIHLLPANRRRFMERSDC